MKNKTNKKIPIYEEEKFSSFLIVIVLFITGLFFAYNSTCYETTNNAVVEGKLISVISRVGGPVINMYAENNLEVKKGDLLMEIDPSFYIGKLRKEEDDLRQAKSKLMELEMQTDENGERIYKRSGLMSRFKFPQNTFSNYAKMFGDEKQQKDADLDKSVLTDPAKDKNKESLVDNKTEKEDIEREMTPDELEDEIKRLELSINQTKLELAYTKIYATQDGIISNIAIEQGEYVGVGQRVISIIPKRVWINAIFKSSQMDSIEIGQPVVVKFVNHKWRSFKGVVEDFNYDKTSPNKTSQNQNIPVRILFTEDYSAYNITPGTPATVKIKVK